MFFLHALKRLKRAQRIARFVYPHLSTGDMVLDFGCGDMLISEQVKLLRSINIYGIDVIRTPQSHRSSIVYLGPTIPFKSKSFDATVCSFVLHHIDDVEPALSECIRVTKRRLLILEDVYTNATELLTLKGLDTLGKLSRWSINLPYNFRTEEGWVKLFHAHQLKVVGVQSIRPEFYRPARHRLFVLDVL